MTIKKKIIITLLSAITVLLCMVLFFARTLLLDSYLHLEEKTVRANVKRVFMALQYDISSLDAVTVDYANWDDTYEFIESRSSNYLESNYVDSTMVNNRLNAVIIVDSSGNIAFEKGFDLVKGQEVPVSSNLKKHIYEFFLQKGDTSGILLLPEGPMIISCSSILTSESTGPARGFLIMGRYIDFSVIEALSEKTQLPVSVIDVSRLNDLGTFNIAQVLLNSREDILVRGINQESVQGYGLVEDIYGKPALVLKIELPREIYAQGQTSIYFFTFIILASSLFILGITLYFLKNTVIKRISDFTGIAAEVSSTGDLSIRIPEKGNDELTSLACAFNSMMKTIDSYRSKLIESNNSYRDLVDKLNQAHQQLLNIVEFLPDATFVIDKEGRIIAWNRALEELTGIHKEQIIGKGNYAYSIPFYGEARPALIDMVISPDEKILSTYENIKRKGSTLFAEIFVPSLFNGKGAYLWLTASPLFDKEGNLTGAIESIRDITERKRMEKQLEFMSTHDHLTGLYNRAYFEQRIKQIEQQGIIPTAIIICDIDGLKFINDTLGHHAGDKLLLAVVDILKGCIKEEAALARVGGDEFAILLPGGNQHSADVICKAVRKHISQYNLDNPHLPLSLSIGCAVAQNMPLNLTEVFKQADNNMYKEKLLHTRSTHSTIVDALSKALEARDFITEGHAKRIITLVEGLAKRMGLSENIINDLQLLAQFHDIGKVGIPDRILFKKGPLTPEEFTEMRRHCEIGYRIAQSSAQLAPIADKILKHHEWWNGDGYPLGLKGEEIPLECRILAVADAYDAMTSDRPYRKALPREQAIQELKRYSGVQFDPAVVLEFIQLLENNASL